MIDGKSLLLAAAATAGSLLVGEAALRVLTPFGPGHAESAPILAPLAGSAQMETAQRYVQQLPAEPGSDRLWFTESPQPLKHEPVDDVAKQRYDDYGRRGLYPTASAYIYNRVLVETDDCQGGSALRNFSGTVKVFDPPAKGPFPRYRFPANKTLASGLVTNQFGLRGPEIALEKPLKTIRIAFV